MRPYRLGMKDEGEYSSKAHVTQVVHSSLARGSRLVRAKLTCIRPIFSSFLLPFPSFIYLFIFLNNMKRTYQIWSQNAMLTPCLVNHDIINKYGLV